MSTGTEHSQDIHQRRRARRKGALKNYRITISLDPGEHREIESVAKADHLTVAAFVADRAVTAARNQKAAAIAVHPLRDALEELNHATAQLQRAGTNLNQAVAALNATGQPPGNLFQYARYTADVARRVDEAADRVQQRLP